LVLLDDVVQIFILAHQGIDAGISFDAFNGGRVSAALVDGDLLRHIVQVNGALQKATRRGQISPGSEEEVRRVAITVNSEVEVLLLTSYFDIGLVKPPTLSNWSFASPKD
jgi:hypothetical protein